MSKIIFLQDFYLQLFCTFLQAWLPIFPGCFLSPPESGLLRWRDVGPGVVNNKYQDTKLFTAYIQHIYTLGGRKVTNENMELQFLKSNILFEGNLFLS